MDQTYSFKVKGSDVSRKEGDKEAKPKELKLDAGHKLAVGDVVLLDDKRAKITSSVLNVETGKFDVEVEHVVDPQDRVIAAEGNDPHPERHAVKDVLFDPNFSPKIVDAVAASNKVIDAHDAIETTKKAADADKKGAGDKLRGHSPTPAGPHEKAAISGR